MAQILMLGIAQQEDSRRAPRIRFNIPRCNSFNLCEEEFVCIFRLSKKLTFQLIEELKPFLEPKTTRKNALNTEIKVLCALSFFAVGCYQKKVGNDYNILVSQSSVSNCIREVSEAMTNNLLRKFVKFPADENEQKVIKDDFFKYCGLGGVLGAIDCTHVAIIAPPDDGFHHEKNYVNRKGWHSMNVQLVCEMNMKILNVVARFPGCSHDAFIWQACNLKKAFENGGKIHGDGWLLDFFPFCLKKDNHHQNHDHGGNRWLSTKLFLENWSRQETFWSQGKLKKEKLKQHFLSSFRLINYQNTHQECRGNLSHTRTDNHLQDEN